MRSPACRSANDDRRERERERDAERVRRDERATHEPAASPVRRRALAVPYELGPKGVGRLQRRDYAGVAGFDRQPPSPPFPRFPPTRPLTTSPAKPRASLTMSVLARRSFGKGGARVMPRYFDRSVGRRAQSSASASSEARTGRHARDDRPRRDVPRDDGSRADERAGADANAAEHHRPGADRRPALDDRAAAAPSRPAVCRAPEPDVARGVLSFTNITPWPTKTSSSIVTPSQMNVWLWILQRAPMTAPRWISTNGPMRVSSPIAHP